jgi:hypothetical protein
MAYRELGMWEVLDVLRRVQGNCSPCLVSTRGRRARKLRRGMESAGGEIGEPPTGFGQLFLVVEGSGWVASGRGRRVEVHAGQGVYFERGERHSKGSDRGMTVLMVQVTELQLPATPVTEGRQ